jgi:hypothetical protein
MPADTVGNDNAYGLLVLLSLLVFSIPSVEDGDLLGGLAGEQKIEDHWPSRRDLRGGDLLLQLFIPVGRPY